MTRLKTFLLRDLSGSIFDKHRALKKRIAKAKQIVVVKDVPIRTRYETVWIHKTIVNYNEVRIILNYEDTLGMHLFIRDQIANPERSVDECAAYLLSSSGEKELNYKLVDWIINLKIPGL